MAELLVQAAPVASVPSVQVHVFEVQTSALPVPSLVYPAAHAVTREVEADVHVRVAPESALVTAVHGVAALAFAVASLKYPASAVQHLSLSLGLVQAPWQEVPVASALA